jgi:hypothetical protein
VWSRATRPRLLNLILVLLLSRPESGATRVSVALTHAGASPTATQTTRPHFANTSDAGASCRVVETTLLGSPPVAWLIWNLVMFLED